MYKFEGDVGSVAAHGDTADKASLQRMADIIFQPGPDDAGYWCAVDQCIGLGHRRPSILGWLERTVV